MFTIIDIVSFLLGLVLSILILKYVNKRNCIILSSNISKELLGTKIYDKKADKCFKLVKKE